MDEGEPEPDWVDALQRLHRREQHCILLCGDGSQHRRQPKQQVSRGQSGCSLTGREQSPSWAAGGSGFSPTRDFTKLCFNLCFASSIAASSRWGPASVLVRRSLVSELTVS